MHASPCRIHRAFLRAAPPREHRAGAARRAARRARARCSASASATARPVREHHGTDISSYPVTPPDAVVFPDEHGRSRRDRQRLRAPPRADDPVRRRHLGRGPRARDQRRRVHRPVADEPHRRGQRQRPRRARRARRHAQAAQRVPARHRPLLPDRSGRRRDARRHGVDARVGHQRRALRHDARERARRHRRAGRRPRHPHRRTRAQVGRRLRPHAPVRRRRRHARHHHRADAAAVRDPRWHVGGGVRVSDA